MSDIAVNQQRVIAKFRRRNNVQVLGVEIVAVAGQQELEVEHRESSQFYLVEMLSVDLRLDSCEELVEIFPEDRAV